MLSYDGGFLLRLVDVGQSKQEAEKFNDVFKRSACTTATGDGPVNKVSAAESASLNKQKTTLGAFTVAALLCVNLLIVMRRDNISPILLLA